MDSTAKECTTTPSNNNQDELILQQQREIEKEVRRSSIVSTKTPESLFVL